MVVASENSIHLTRSHRRIRTRSSDDCNRPLVRPYAVRLLQAATAAGSRNPNTAASAQRPAAAHAAPSTAFALDRPRADVDCYPAGPFAPRIGSPNAKKSDGDHRGCGAASVYPIRPGTLAW